MTLSAPPVSESYLLEFLNSMPASYRYSLDEKTTAGHAALTLAREMRPAIVGRFESARDVGTAFCIVADDRPGLLAILSAAFVMHDLDVVHAEAYTRTTGARRREAVDLFWVRRTPGASATPIEEDLPASLENTITLLMARGSLPESPLPSGNRRSTGSTRVRFVSGSEGSEGLSVLEVEADDRPGLLLALSRALAEQQVQIVSSAVTTEKDRVLDRFTVEELNGQPISQNRRLELQVAVLTALDY